MDPTTSENLNNNPSNPTLIGNPGTNDQHDVLGFVSEGSQPPVEFSYSHLSNLAVESAGDHHHDISTILSRPTKIADFTLNSSDAQGTVDLVSNVLNTMLTRSSMLKNKLDAFYGLSGDFCIRVVLNATPFQTGLYMLFVHPTFMRYTTQESWSICSMYTSSTGLSTDVLLTNWSGHPHVLINVGSTSEVTIKVPYCGVRPMIDLSELSSVRATVACCSPVRGPTNSESINCSMYAWIENAQLLGAGSPLLTNSEFPGSNASVVSPQASNINLANIMAMLQKLQPSQSEEAATQQQAAPAAPSSSGGAVSGIADTVGSIASGLTAIPGVADIAGPVSWVAKGIGSVAKMFGFSKPHDPEPSKPVHQNPFREFAHVDSVSEATKLSLSKDSSVHVRSLGPTQKDEMAIAHIVQHPNLFLPFKWTTSDTTNKNLYSTPISPAIFFKYRNFDVSNYGNTAVRSETFLSYLSSLFMYWRGSIRFTFTIAANKFYSGRLRVVYQLDQSGTADNVSPANVLADLGKYYSKVIDIRDANTFTVDVPYIDVNPFRPTSTNDMIERCPYLWIFVEKPLVASATVNSTVEVWISVAGGEDFMFAGPRLADKIFLLPKVDSIVSPPTKARVVVPQGFTQNETSEDSGGLIRMAEGPHSHANIGALARSIGDPISSLRALMHRPIEHVRIAATERTYTIVNPYILFVSTRIQTTGTFLDFTRMLYRFCSGSLRISIRGLDRTIPYRFKLVDVSHFGRNKRIHASGLGGFQQVVEATGNTTEDTFSALPTIADVIYREDLQGFANFEIPFYTNYEKFDNTPYSYGTTTQYPYAPFMHGNVALAFYNPVTCEDVSIYVSAADDFNCGYLIGAPITYGTNEEV